VSAEPLPDPQRGVRGALGRPTWREARVRREAEALRAHPIWEGEGVPDGRGRTVVLVPGFMAGERSMSLMEPWLRRCGWDTVRAPVGRNRAAGWKIADLVEAALEDHDGPVPVVAHSRGGQEARVVAVRRPDRFSLLVTLGAPHRVLYPSQVLIRATVASLQLSAKVRRRPADPEADRRYDEDRVAPFPPGVPFVSVWSRSDGFVDWRACLDPAAESVEVDASHFGLTGSVPGFQAVAAALERLG
jgi:pimeloyl-ACP methyl ester carboxylesterase